MVVVLRRMKAWDPTDMSYVPGQMLNWAKSDHVVTYKWENAADLEGENVCYFHFVVHCCTVV